MNSLSPSLDDLSCMAAIFDHGSVTEAALRLRVSQPTISHALNRLRAHFGDPLFVRVGRRMEPTARAEALRGQLTTALDAVSAIGATPDFRPDRSQRTFRLATADFLQSVLVPSLMQRLTREAPDVRLALVPAGQGRDVFQGSDIDILISLRSIAQPSFHARDILKDSYVVMGRADHALLAAPLTLDGYAAANHVMVSPRGQGFHGPVDQALEQQGRSRRVSLALTSFWTAAEVVSQTDMLVTLPSRFHAHCHTRFPLACQPLPLTVDDVLLTMFWHERHHADPAHRWFRGMVADIAGATTPDPDRDESRTMGR